ncbi:ThiF family adenylyltransferase [Virgibacillus alimentarius]|uniref:Adenylyltransferase/sulfurtransferase n=1 Tax=Virgibacillus alimentarius TaxID=698769 RepID=A0ABS4S4U5_9BACI|nr:MULTISPECIES: ThiF family adenylyltransferase [Virgibacillus]MBP2256512.1 adenylyltransferase/sulfurtransferase [Virgibacillus alimentarius]HLR66458.1 ThiF family adenylyltransferase [Virgibacillus sp.]
MNIERYSRQRLFSPIGDIGQERIGNCSILVVGVGALGTVLSNHLVRAGIGKLRIVDRDYVEYSNLQRQMLFDEDDVEKALPKAVAAKQKLKKINSEVHIEAFVENVTNNNINKFIDGIDIVLDGTDNFSTRFLLNDICYKRVLPFSYGGVVGSRGMSAFFIPNETPCLRCLTKEEAESGQTCDTVGVIAPAVDIVSSMQVTEVFKYITGNKAHLRNTLQTYDIWYNQQYEMKFPSPDPKCPTCQHAIYPSLQRKATENETVLCGRNTVQIHQKSNMDLKKSEKKLARVAKTQLTPFLLKVQFNNEINFVIFPDGRVLIQGTEDTTKARNWYDRYIGS